MNDFIIAKDSVLYIDCDGVILNTIDMAFQIMRENGLDDNNQKEIHSFFVNVDWFYLIERSGVIKNSIEKIKKIIESGNFREVHVLTKFCDGITEMVAKDIFFTLALPKTKVIFVRFEENKDEIVDPIGNVLVDDSLSNVKRWREKKGVGIHFVKNNPNYDNDEISDFDELYEANSIRSMGYQKVKTRFN